MSAISSLSGTFGQLCELGPGLNIQLDSRFALSVADRPLPLFHRARGTRRAQEVGLGDRLRSDTSYAD
jgi:hypothetical protein